VEKESLEEGRQHCWCKSVGCQTFSMRIKLNPVIAPFQLSFRHSHCSSNQPSRKPSCFEFLAGTHAKWLGKCNSQMENDVPSWPSWLKTCLLVSWIEAVDHQLPVPATRTLPVPTAQHWDDYFVSSQKCDYVP